MAYPKCAQNPHISEGVKNSHQNLILEGFQDFIISCFSGWPKTS